MDRVQINPFSLYICTRMCKKHYVLSFAVPAKLGLKTVQEVRFSNPHAVFAHNIHRCLDGFGRMSFQGNDSFVNCI